MASHEAEAHWTIEDLDFSRIALDRVRSDENLFYLVAAASFIESGSDLYTHNLVDFFRGDEEVTAWLSTQWEQEELQHGKALRAYVEYVWPEFPWERPTAASSRSTPPTARSSCWRPRAASR